jgi:hypothetical protein
MFGWLAERQLGDATRLKRVVALFQRELGDIFGNARVRRRNRRYELGVAVYEKPVQRTGQAYRMTDRQIRVWIKQAADRAHPRLYRRMRVQTGPWQQGRVSQKLYSPVTIRIDANQD